MIWENNPVSRKSISQKTEMANLTNVDFCETEFFCFFIDISFTGLIVPYRKEKTAVY